MAEYQPKYDEDENRPASTSPTTQLLGAVAGRKTTKNFAHGAARLHGPYRWLLEATCFTGAG